jgi:hypothetical protein
MYIEIPIKLINLIKTTIAAFQNFCFTIGIVYLYCTIFNKIFSWFVVAILYTILSFVYIPIRNFVYKKVVGYLEILNDGVE